MMTGLPLGICKQAVMKLESALVDINEIIEDETLIEPKREIFRKLSEYLNFTIASIYNQVMEEMDEDSFVNETIEMDEIPHWPESEDILDEPMNV